MKPLPLAVIRNPPADHESSLFFIALIEFEREDRHKPLSRSTRMNDRSEFANQTAVGIAELTFDARRNTLLSREKVSTCRKNQRARRNPPRMLRATSVSSRILCGGS